MKRYFLILAVACTVFVLAGGLDKLNFNGEKKSTSAIASALSSLKAAAVGLLANIYEYDFDNKKSPPISAVPSPAFIEVNEIHVHYIDLGQADGILIQSAQNAVLIDGGERKTQDALIDYLRNAGVAVIDYIVATHPHSDHIGGLSEVILQFDVKNVVMPNVTNNTATFESLLSAIEDKGLSVTVPSVGDKITAGIIAFTVLAPGKDFGDLNNASIVLRLSHGETAFIFTGDAEALSEKEMLKSGQNLRADVLKAGHHGSRTSTTPEFLNAVSPSMVVVTCAKGNSYGHPHKEFLKLLSQPGQNIPLFRTDESGTVVITTDGREIKLYFAKDNGSVQHAKAVYSD